MNEEQIPPKPKDKRTKRYKQWVAKYEKSSDGVGDTVEKITEATGIKKVVKFLAGEDCGCDQRKDKLNNLFPYNKPNCFTEDEFDFLTEIFSDDKWQFKSISAAKVKDLYVIYNRVFNTADVPSGCSSCVANRLKDLEKLYKQYS
tara:strand:- start:107 stop:541 length:435 start_codon:yes stop_codon:yes gene_type:complete